MNSLEGKKPEKKLYIYNSNNWNGQCYTFHINKRSLQ